MASRLELQAVLEEILGSKNVYYQPPASVSMRYPSIVYSRDDIENFHADNRVYNQYTVYMITVIDKNPDSCIVKKVSMLPLCSYDRHYVADNLYHDTFILYF